MRYYGGRVFPLLFASITPQISSGRQGYLFFVTAPHCNAFNSLEGIPERELALLWCADLSGDLDLSVAGEYWTYLSPMPARIEKVIYGSTRNRMAQS